jgi:preprotein translocase subunit YajC
MSAFVLILIPIAIYLFVRANPQRRRVMAQQALLKGLSPGDRVVTAGGMIGTLVAMEGEHAAVELAPGVVVEFLAPAILRRLDEPADDASVAPSDEQVDAANIPDDLAVPDDLSGLTPPTPPAVAPDPVDGHRPGPSADRPEDAPSTPDPLGRRPEES